MTLDPLTLHGQTILVVDGCTLAAAELSHRLTGLGAKVCVAANAACAARYVEGKRFDLALVGFGTASMNRPLIKALERRGVPYIHCASTTKLEHVDYAHAFSLALQPAA
jgi:DNA-binding NtrC family response regulator